MSSINLSIQSIIRQSKVLFSDHGIWKKTGHQFSFLVLGIYVRLVYRIIFRKKKRQLAVTPNRWISEYAVVSARKKRCSKHSLQLLLPIPSSESFKIPCRQLNPSKQIPHCPLQLLSNQSIYREANPRFSTTDSGFEKASEILPRANRITVLSYSASGVQNLSPPYCSLKSQSFNASATSGLNAVAPFKIAKKNSKLRHFNWSFCC